VATDAFTLWRGPGDNNDGEDSRQPITCPSCGRKITVTEALAQQIAGPVLARKTTELRQ
jgi:hypothetical protein